MEDFKYTQYDAAGKSVRRHFSIEGRRLSSETRRFGLFLVSPAKQAVITSPKVTFYEDDKAVSYLSARRCVSDFDFGKDIGTDLRGKLVFTGDAVLRSALSGASLVAQEIAWYNVENVIVARGVPGIRPGDGAQNGGVVRIDPGLKGLSPKNSQIRDLGFISQKVEGEKK